MTDPLSPKNKQFVISIGGTTQLIIFFYMFCLLAIAVVAPPDTRKIFGGLAIFGLIGMAMCKSWNLTITEAGIFWNGWHKWSCSWQEITGVEVEEVEVANRVPFVNPKDFPDEIQILHLRTTHTTFHVRSAYVPQFGQIVKLIRKVKESGWESAVQSVEIQVTPVSLFQRLFNILFLFIVVLLGIFLAGITSAVMVDALKLTPNSSLAKIALELGFLIFLGVYIAVLRVFKVILMSNKKRK